MSLKNVGGSGPLRPGNIFGKPQLPKSAPANTQQSITRPAQGDQFQIGLEARQKISQAASEISLPTIGGTTPRDQILNAKNLNELVDNIFAKEFPGAKLPQEHAQKLKEFISSEMDRMGLDFNRLKQVL